MFVDDQVIIAQCTPVGKGAIALLRLCGSQVRQIVSKFCALANNKNIIEVPSGTVNFGKIITSDSQTIDQVLYLVMDGPKTFTGENTIEITCHNNPFIIESIIALAISHGARLAQEGEFTRRAFLNNKIDLLQAEAINELINANTQIAIKSSMAQLTGSLTSFISEIEKELIRALAWCEASFEFLDDESEFGQQINEHIQDILKKIKNIKTNFNLQQQIRSGIRIAIVGSVNAGKSSIFNALLNKERAIVTNIAGTTRDVIESSLYKNGNFWTLIDTAGLRQTNDIIESQGIERSFQEAATSDIILLVFDASRKLTAQEDEVYNKLIEQYKNKIILVQNKSDLSDSQILNFTSSYICKVSSSTKQNLDTLEKIIEIKIQNLFSELDCPFLLNKRQYNLLLSLEQNLNIILEQLSGAIQYEIISYNLKDALECLSELTGKTISESALDTVFKEFCVGK